MSQDHPAVTGPAQVELVVEAFAGAGLDGQVRARLWVDKEPRHLVMFGISDADKTRVSAESDDDIGQVWATAMVGMTSRLRAELEYTGIGRFSDPIVVNSHLRSASPTFGNDSASRLTEPGTLLARFDL